MNYCEKSREDVNCFVGLKWGENRSEYFLQVHRFSNASEKFRDGRRKDIFLISSSHSVGKQVSGNFWESYFRVHFWSNYSVRFYFISTFSSQERKRKRDICYNLLLDGNGQRKNILFTLSLWSRQIPTEKNFQYFCERDYRGIFIGKNNFFLLACEVFPIPAAALLN